MYSAYADGAKTRMRLTRAFVDREDDEDVGDEVDEEEEEEEEEEVLNSLEGIFQLVGRLKSFIVFLELFLLPPRLGMNIDLSDSVLLSSVMIPFS